MNPENLNVPDAKNIRVAFGTVPKDGGTYTFFSNMREPLAKKGIELISVTVGAREAGLVDQSFVQEGCVFLAEKEWSVKKQAQAFVRWAEKNEINAVFGVNSEAILSALKHLPDNIHLFARCANSFDHGYQITVAGDEQLSLIVALAPIQIDTLVEEYGAPKDKIKLIPNGADTQRFRAKISDYSIDRAVHLCFMGRLEHKQKGVLYLPKIVACLEEKGVNFHLNIAGRGVELANLKKQFATHISDNKVSFHGLLSPEEVPAFLKQQDIFLFPSHFEGCSNALLEALMSGCIPVAWRIHGLTDHIIQHGRNGLLADQGDTLAMADQIANLCVHPEKLREMSNRVAAHASARFSLEQVAESYNHAIREAISGESQRKPSLPWRDFNVFPAFERPLWKKIVPQRLSVAIKKIL